MGNLLSAVPPHYAVALLGRVVAALCHGPFFGAGSLVAAAGVRPGGRGGTSRASALEDAGGHGPRG